MSLKLFIFMAPVALGGYYFASGSSSSFTRDVDRSPAQVAAAISDLDIRSQPGSPGTDPTRSGGVRPVFRTERTADGVSFVVWSGDKVATRMIAHLEPLDGGRRTRIRGEVVRGDAPDEQVSPAFRSNSTTLALFTVALNQEVDQLLSPPRRGAADCRAMEQRLLEENEANSPTNSGLEGIRNLNRMSEELRRQGCNPGGFNRGNQAFQAPSNRMGNAPVAAMGPAPTDGTSFRPGQPMVDVGTGRR